MDEKIDIIKINSTIDDMEQQVKKLKSITAIYERLEDLNKKVQINKASMDSIIAELDSASVVISASINNSSDVLVNIKNNIDAMKQELEQNVSALREESVQVVSNILSNIERDVVSNIETIRKENRENYRSLEDVTSSKLERNKSDLTVEIRNVGNSTEKNIESKLNQGLINLEKSLIERFIALESKLMQSFKDNRILFYVILGTSIINIILSTVVLVKM